MSRLCLHYRRISKRKCNKWILTRFFIRSNSYTFYHPIILLLNSSSFYSYPHHPRRPTQMLVTTDADARIDRRRCTYRPTRMHVSTDADDILPPLAIIAFRILKIIMRAKAVARGLFISDYIEPTAPMPSIRSTSTARSFHNTIYIRLRLVE